MLSPTWGAKVPSCNHLHRPFCGLDHQLGPQPLIHPQCQLYQSCESRYWLMKVYLSLLNSEPLLVSTDISQIHVHFTKNSRYNTLFPPICYNHLKMEHEIHTQVFTCLAFLRIYSSERETFQQKQNNSDHR